MTDMICRKSMQRCQTPGMCSPHGGCPNPTPAPVYLSTQKMAVVPFDLLDKSVNGFEYEQGRARNELREMLAVPGNTGMGVGDGSGRLFIHGDYDSIKAMQAIILERDALRAQLEVSEGTRQTLRKCLAQAESEIDALRDMKLPHFLLLSDEMRAAGDHAVSRAREDGCASVPVLYGVFFEAAIQRWLNDQEEIIEAAEVKSRPAVQLPAKTPAPKHLVSLTEETTRLSRNATIDEVAALNDRPAGCCCPPPGHTGIWGAGMCPVHQGLRRTQYCECPPGTDRCITQGGHFPACTACKRRLKP